MNEAGVGSRPRGAAGVALGLLALAMGIVLLPVAAQARDGFPDHGFGDYGRAVAFEEGRHGVDVAPGGDGSVVAGTSDIVLRFGADGNLDESFGDEGRATIPDLGGMPFEIGDVDVDAEGRILVFGAVKDLDTIVRTGYFMAATNPTQAAVVRLDPSGEIDREFGEDGYFVGDLDQPGFTKLYDEPITRVKQGLIRPDGSLLVLVGVGELRQGPSVRAHFVSPSRVLAILTPGGEIDRTFGRGDGILVDNPKIARIRHVSVNSSGEMLIRAELVENGWLLARLEASGVPDTDFGNDGFLGSPRREFDALTVGPAGRIVMANRSEAIRLTPEGRPDFGFGHGGRARIRMPGNSEVASVRVGDFGRVLVSGTQAVRERRGDPDSYRRSFTVIALDARGRPDRDFGRGGWIASPFGPGSPAKATTSALDGEGHLVVGGRVYWEDEARESAIGLVRYDLAE